MNEQVDWEGLKVANSSLVGPNPSGSYWANVGKILEAFPAILAQHERDQRVIEAAKKLIDALENRVNLNHMLAARAEFDKVTK